MRVRALRRLKRWVRHRPMVGVAVSLALHVMLIGTLYLLRAPSTPDMVKRGEPLFVELPPSEELAQRGAPAGSAPSDPAPNDRPPAKEPPAPKVQPTRPAPPVAKVQPAPKAAPRAPEPPRAPERPSVASPPPPVPSAPEASPPDPESSRVAAAPPKAAEPPAAAEPTPPAEAPPRQPAPASPPPRIAALPPQREPTVDGLSALRRRGSGPGGAGGRGEGWAGIEGEPIPLDSTDPRYNDYLDRIRRMIKEKWGYPCIKDLATGHCDYKSARLVIVFGILKNGQVPTLEVLQQSGYGIYDDYAANAIRLASPFPPVPPALMATAGASSTGVRITAAFQYVLVESSLTNILR